MYIDSYVKIMYINMSLFSRIFNKKNLILNKLKSLKNLDSNFNSYFRSLKSILFHYLRVFLTTVN